MDHIVVGSDSGRVVVLLYNKDTNQFDKIHQETYGKSGCRRIEPGQYLACDPKGRAIMIGAVEKKKLVYVINRDASARLTILSPLEAHKAHNIVFDMVGVDVGFDNPIFACLEMNYTDADQDPTGEAAAETPKVRAATRAQRRRCLAACRPCASSLLLSRGCVAVVWHTVRRLRCSPSTSWTWASTT